MNPRVTTIVIGVLTTVMGAFALLYPETVMNQVTGFAVAQNFTANFVLGEMRATYGGIFTVLGIYTILGAMDPATNRGRLLMIGLLWVGACLGRLYGVLIDGSPGWWGWLLATFEAVVGGMLVAVSQMTPEAPAAITRSSYTPPPPPPTTPTATAPVV
ncbi:MAG: DUF4345 domain-containing protein [Deltaproteobacteria bacterium]|nr:DUF4345 domain-containing protein [Deltaproteobacteria bacterium]